jgi:hypothetical protein
VTLGNLLATGAVTPVIEGTCPIEQVPEGLCFLSKGHAVGKLVVTS